MQSLSRLSIATAVVALGLASLRCGLTASPGDYLSGGVARAEGGVSPPTIDGAPADAVAAIESAAPTSIVGRLAVLAGERDPTSDDDDPAWSADAWLGDIDSTGHVARWSIVQSAPLVGPFDVTAVLGTSWVSFGYSYGINGGRESALQVAGWAPGPAGGWKATFADMPDGLQEPSRTIFGNRLVVVGGFRSSTVDGGNVTSWTKEVHVAAIDPAVPSLGATASAGKSLVVARSRAGLFASSNRLYVVGGRANGATIAGVESAPIDPAAGTIGDFVASSPMVGESGEHKVFSPRAVVASGYLYVVGGNVDTNGTASDVVVAAKIDPASGVVGEFTPRTKLPRKLRDFGLVAHGGRLFVVGGQVDATTRSDEVLSSVVGLDGVLSAWDVSNAKLPSPRSDVVAIAY